MQKYSFDSNSMDRKEDFLSKMTERRNIVDFVREVEKYPCVYDLTHAQYANRTYAVQAWREIAKKLESTVPECKEKWRKIRIAFMRSLKICKTGNPPSRPYYLTEHLQFILPFMKISEQSPVNHHQSPASPATSSDDDRLEIDFNRTKQENETDSDSRNINVFVREQENNMDSDDNRNSNIFVANFNDSIVKGTNEVNRPRHQNYKKRKYDYCETNPRKMFLLSILPEVDEFSDQEMRLFRRDVIGSIDRIIAVRDNHS